MLDKRAISYLEAAGTADVSPQPRAHRRRYGANEDVAAAAKKSL